MSHKPSQGYAASVVFRKELVDGLRDWRSLMSALLYPLLGPLMIAVFFFLIIDSVREPDVIELPVVGAAHAPQLIAWLTQHQVTIVEAPADPKQAVRDGTVDLVLRIPANYQERMAAGRHVPVALFADMTQKSLLSQIRKLQRLIATYGQQVGSLRLIARGVNPEIAAAVVVEEVNVSRHKPLAAVLLNMLPLFVVMGAFVCGMQIAIDATAGERERGSLESLLINPVPRSALVLGKWAAAVVFSAVGLTLTLAGSLAMLRIIPVEEIGVRLDLGLPEMLGLLAAILPMSLLAPGLQLLISTFARTYKEAQTYVSLLIFLPMVPFLYSTSHHIKPEAWMYPVPILGQQVLLTEVLGGRAPTVLQFGLSGLASLCVGVACVWLTARLFARESIVFGR